MSREQGISHGHNAGYSPWEKRRVFPMNTKRVFPMDREQGISYGHISGLSLI